MGVMTGTVSLTRNAKESLDNLRQLVGKKIGVDMMVNAKNPKEATVMFQFDDLSAAEKHSEKMMTALKEAGLEGVSNPAFMSRKLD
ncbi:MAG: hypothetical protein COB16_13115 [Rhodobacteraceae bacterium]|nr:MAG: hypothetical protein COB16_13115 [Paracoccaceae bacterium]